MEYRLAKTKSRVLCAMILASRLPPGQLAPAFRLLLNHHQLRLGKGQSKKLRASLQPRREGEPAQPLRGKSLLWHSSDPTVATVSKKGRVRAVKRGKCFISAYTTDGSLATACCVRVRKSKK